MSFENEDFSFDIEGVEEGGVDGTFNVQVETPESEEDNKVIPEFTDGPEQVDDEPDTREEDTFEIDIEGNDDNDTDDPDGGKGGSEDVNDKPSTNEGAPSSPSRANALSTQLASALFKDGVLSGITEEDIKNVGVKGLGDLIKKTIETNEYSALGETGKEALKAINNGVPVENVAKHHNNEIKLNSIREENFIEGDDDTEEIAESKKQARFNIIYNDNIARGYKPEVAKRKTESSFKAGDDEQDAKDSLAHLKDVAKQNKEDEYAQAEKAREKAIEDREKLQTKLRETKEVLPGIPVSKEVASWLADAATTATGRKDNGALRTVVTDKRDDNPELFNTRLNYFIKMGLFDEKPDLGFLGGKRNLTSAIDELEKNLTDTGRFDGGNGISDDAALERERQVNSDLLDALDNADF